MSWTTYTVYNFADDLHWPALGILLESIDYHEAARKASFLGSMCEDPLMAAIHFERRFDAVMKYVINSREHPIGKVKDCLYRKGQRLPTGARNSSLGHPNMAQASLNKNFPKVIPSLLHVFSGWYLQRLVIWCVSLSRPQNIWCKRRHITRRRGDVSSRDARISTFV